ncbi:MAG: ATP-binding cassette domain-containing protein, partial [Pseudomonadota bacterium]
ETSQAARQEPSSHELFCGLLESAGGELIARAHVDSPFDFTFKKPEKLPNPLLRLESANIGYGEKTVVREVAFSLAPGDRIGLLGPNGAGKSTLIKLLAGELVPLSGVRKAARDLKIGYFAQHQLEQLRLDESPLWHVRRLDPTAVEKDLRNFLGGFAFCGDAALAPTALLSGGEKARLVLALLVYGKPNLLLLDEPTNHLDLEMRHALSVALQDYDGAMVVVSHDRHLLRTVTDQLVLVADNSVQAFNGDLDDYRQWLMARRSDTPLVQAQENALSRKERRRLEAKHRQRFKPLIEALKRAEHRLEQLHKEKVRLEGLLGDSSVYESLEKDRLKALLMDKADLDRDLEKAENAWMETSLLLEEAERNTENAF